MNCLSSHDAGVEAEVEVQNGRVVAVHHHAWEEAAEVLHDEVEAVVFHGMVEVVVFHGVEAMVFHDVVEVVASHDAAEKVAEASHDVEVAVAHEDGVEADPEDHEEVAHEDDAAAQSHFLVPEAAHDQTFLPAYQVDNAVSDLAHLAILPADHALLLAEEALYSGARK